MQVDVPIGAVLDLGDLPLLAPQTLQCTALDPDGKEIACAIRAFALDPLPHSAMRHQVHYARTNHFATTIEPVGLQLSPGRYRFQVIDAVTQHGPVLSSDTDGQAGLVVIQEIDTRTLTDGRLRFQLARGCRVRLEVTAAEATTSFYWKNAAGQSLLRVGLHGTYTYDQYFPAGNYVMTLRESDGRETSRAVRLGPEGFTLRWP
jgi:hypothetical protein